VKHALSFAMTMSILAALGCAEEAPVAAAEPEAVAPVEVTQAVTATEEGEDELTTLRARVAELEQQLATCQGAAAPSGTQAVAIPEGADVPAEGTTPTAQSARPDAGTRARRQRDPSLLDTILGPDGRRRRRTDDETIEIPNPANVLLGN
jgi:hypothetical protein